MKEIWLEEIQKSFGSNGSIDRHYWPVFPLLLSPVYKAFGMNLNAMKMEIIIIFMLAILAIFFVFKQKLRPIYTLALLGLVGFNPYFWDIKDRFFSERSMQIT